MKIEHKIVKGKDYGWSIFITIVYIFFIGSFIFIMSWMAMQFNFVFGIIVAIVGIIIATIDYMKHKIYEPLETEEVQHIIKR